MANQHPAFAGRLAVVLCLLSVVGAVLGSSCGDGTFDPTAQPEFLTPVSQAQDAGITPYWLGRDFQSDGVEFRLMSKADFFEPGTLGPGVHLDYMGYAEDRGGHLLVETYPTRGSRETTMLEIVRKSRGGHEREIEVGVWQGTLWTLESGTRPVNTLVLFMSLDDMVIEVMAKAGTSGVPGDDSNPLIDGDLLIEVVADILRPYPE